VKKYQRWFFICLAILSLTATVTLFQNCGKATKQAAGKNSKSDSEVEEEIKRSFDDFSNSGDNSSDPQCDFNGEDLEHGDSVTAYQNSTVPFGSSCVSQVRICQDGILSGSFNFASCTPGAPAACLFNGVTVNHTESITGWRKIATAGDAAGAVGSCVSSSLACSNGDLAGASQFPLASCTADAKKTCQFDGKQYAHGAVVVGFKESTVAPGQACKDQAMICNDGMLAGSDVYKFPSCSAAKNASCKAGTATYAHGQNAGIYADDEVDYPKTCQKVTKTCTNGAWPGMSKAFNTCEVYRTYAKEGPYYVSATAKKTYVDVKSATDIDIWWNGTLVVDGGGKNGFVKGSATYYIESPIASSGGVVNGVYKKGKYKVSRKVRSTNLNYKPTEIK